MDDEIVLVVRDDIADLELVPMEMPSPEPVDDTEAEATSPDDIAPSTRAIRIPRPPNAFILYRKDYHHKIKAANPGIHNNEICRLKSHFHSVAALTPLAVITGSQWNNETKEVRDKYYAKAKKVREEFLKINPNYRYQPRRPSEKKRRRKRISGSLAHGRSIIIGDLDRFDIQCIQNEDREATADAPATEQEEVLLNVCDETITNQELDVDEFNREFHMFINLECFED